MFAIRADREYVVEEDFMKAVRKVADNKKLESKLDYKPVWEEIIIIIQLYIIWAFQSSPIKLFYRKEKTIFIWKYTHHPFSQEHLPTLAFFFQAWKFSTEMWKSTFLKAILTVSEIDKLGHKILGVLDANTKFFLICNPQQ